MIELGNQQKEAIEKIIDFVNDKDYSKENICFSLTGCGGSGKSTCLLYLLNNLEKDYNLHAVLSALTHKASVVLKQIVNRPTFTLHSVLNMSPNIRLEELDMRDLKFYRNKNKPNNIPFEGLLVIDEASMINNVLFDLLIELCEECCCKILFVSDPKQLQPVKSFSKSKVYTCKNKYELTEIHRQSEDNPLIQVLTYLRDKPLMPQDWKNGYSNDNGNFIIERNIDKFIDTCYDVYCQDENSKILCYTNERVKFYNEKMKSKIYVLDETPYPPGCILTGYENIKFGLEYIIYNGDDYKIIQSEPKKKNLIYNGRKLQLNGYSLLLHEIGDKSQKLKSVYLLDDNNDFATIASWIEEARNNAILDNTWHVYYRLMDSFCTFNDIVYTDGRIVKKKTFDYGYASTIHRSQGSTYQNVMIDMWDVYKLGRKEELRQLQYVGLSRTKKDVYMYLI